MKGVYVSYYQGTIVMYKLKGFTFVELLIAVAILSITFSAALPSLSSMIGHRKADSSVDTLITVFSLARSEAVLSNQIVTICPTNDFINCSGDWIDPLMAFTDGDNSKSITGDEKLIYTFNTQDTGIALEVHPTHKNYFQYAGTGLSHGTPGNIVFCSNTGNVQFARQIVISFSGRIRISRDTNQDGVVDDSYGDSLVCS